MIKNSQHVKEKAAHFEYEKILQNSPKHIRKQQHGWILFPSPFEQQTTATAGFFFFLLFVERRALFFRFAFCR